MDTSSAGTEQNTVVFEENSYDVWLLLDSREIHGRVDRGYFQKHLTSNGVKVLTRNLPIGDVIWATRRRVESPDEIVLDYIVERKVYEDLTSSFKDGRYKNQKQRMETCGLRNKIYIIQKSHGYGNGREYAIKAGVTMAMIKSQLVQNFFAKQADSVHESVEYLVRLTRKIEDMLQGRRLVASDVSNDADKSRGTSLELQDSERLMTYKLFAFLNLRADSECLGKVWVKQLMTIRGVSLTKALTIRKAYPTMRHLLDAFNECETDSQRIWLLTKLKRYGLGTIGQALARRVMDQMCSREYKL